MDLPIRLDCELESKLLVMMKTLVRLKRILRIKYSHADLDFLFLNELRSRGLFSNVRREGNLISFSVDNGRPLLARPHPHSDAYVLRQIFIDEEYKPVVDFFIANGMGEVTRIIDAGANVGFTSSYFLRHFPGANIACVEPDTGNAELLKANLKSYIENGSVVLYQNALMADEGKNLVIDKTRGEGTDWAISVNETAGETDLKSVTVSRIMQELGWQEVDVLKIDIEGAERFVFGKDADLSYLGHVKLLAIEIHDEFGIREDIYRELRENGFLIVNFGETTLGLNKRYANL